MPAALEEPRIWRELDLVKVILRSNLKREDIETLRKTVEPVNACVGVPCVGGTLASFKSDGRTHCRTASLDVQDLSSIILCTYGFGLAPLLRGKLFEREEREKGQGESLRELMKGRSRYASSSCAAAL